MLLILSFAETSSDSESIFAQGARSAHPVQEREVCLEARETSDTGVTQREAADQFK